MTEIFVSRFEIIERNIRKHLNDISCKKLIPKEWTLVRTLFCLIKMMHYCNTHFQKTFGIPHKYLLIILLEWYISFFHIGAIYQPGSSSDSLFSSSQNSLKNILASSPWQFFKLSEFCKYRLWAKSFMMCLRHSKTSLPLIIFSLIKGSATNIFLHKLWTEKLRTTDT